MFNISNKTNAQQIYLRKKSNPKSRRNSADGMRYDRWCLWGLALILVSDPYVLLLHTWRKTPPRPRGAAPRAARPRRPARARGRAPSVCVLWRILVFACLETYSGGKTVEDSPLLRWLCFWAGCRSQDISEREQKKASRQHIKKNQI